MDILDFITSPFMAVTESINDRRRYNRYRHSARAQGMDVPQLGIFSAVPDVPMDFLQSQMVQGQPLADSRNTATGLYYGGGIDGGQYQSSIQAIDQGIYDQQQANARQGASLALGWANHNLAKARQEALLEQQAQDLADFENTVALVMPHASPDQKALLRNGDRKARENVVSQLIGNINAAPGAQAALELQARQAYTQAVEPLLSYRDTLTSAGRYLGDVPFDSDFWSTPSGRAAAGEVARAVQVAQSRFWTETMGRSDAPTEAEAQQLQSIFAQVNNGGLFNLDENQRETLRLFLKREQAWNDQAIARERVRFTGQVEGDPARVLETYGPQGDGLPEIEWDER